MLGYNRWHLFKGLAASFCILGIVSLALIYFIPAPPSKVVMATGVKGSSFEYFAKQYREIFARSNIELELRETAGAVETVKLLQDPKSDVQIALMIGGVSDGKHAPGLLSLGTVYNNPFWIFALKREDVCQEGFNALVHRCPQDAGPERAEIIDRKALAADR
jgi:TRAP-type uncharacterized transport system substrate-binding protein